MDYTYVIVCREFDKFRGQPPVTYVVKRDVTPDENINFFKLRGIYNSELEYYLTKAPVKYTNDEIIQFIKGHNFKEPYAIRL